MCKYDIRLQLFVIFWIYFFKVILVIVFKFRIFFLEDLFLIGFDVEKQLFEVVRLGDMEVVKVNGNIFVNYQVLGYVYFKIIIDERCCQKYVYRFVYSNELF